MSKYEAAFFYGDYTALNEEITQFLHAEKVDPTLPHDDSETNSTSPQ